MIQASSSKYLVYYCVAVILFVVLDAVWLHLSEGTNSQHSSFTTTSTRQKNGTSARANDDFETEDNYDDNSLFLMGHWINDTKQTKPYKLTNSFLPHWNESALFFWEGGDCHNRPNYQLRWIPGTKNYQNDGDHDGEDEKTTSSSGISIDLTLDQWKADFCQKYDGKHFLFVGDSVMGQTFTSFVHLLGGIFYEHNGSYSMNGNQHDVMIDDAFALFQMNLLPPKDRRRSFRKFRRKCGSCVHEIAISTITCARGKTSAAISDTSNNNQSLVRATFVRHDQLLLNGISVKNPKNTLTRPTFEIRADWTPFVDESVHFLVLNTGRHYQPMNDYIRNLNTTLTWLEENGRGMVNVNNSTRNDSSTVTAAASGHRPDMVKFFMSTRVESVGRTVWYNRKFKGQQKTAYHGSKMQVEKGVSSYMNSSSSNNLCYTDSNRTPAGDYVPYHLDEIEAENSQAKMFIHVNFPHVRYIDYSCLDLQNDRGYKDAAHSCMPGPIDYRVYTFMQILLKMS